MDRIITCIVQALLCPHFVKDPGHHDIAHASEILYRKVMTMPTLLRWPMIVAVYGFNILGIATAGQTFVAQNLHNRQRHIRLWQDSPIGVLRDVAAFFQKMTYFIYFSLCPEKPSTATS